ncbi:MAG TPA: MdtA/MuxA family multidrug efflux RND transporter periplasmic adaptor subunit [Stellaceae bacterium]|nr:MdtA/MuxA family multidrug efflux RND transporter periplasmic adaptor subunit [Stellaceae bacterium]
MPRWRRAAWIALLLLAAGAFVWWLSHRVPAERPAGRFGAGGAMPVVVAPVTQGNIDIVFNALGTVTPTATVTVRSQISGHLTQILFREGQTVQKGDLLAVIDPRPYELALEQAQGQLLKDQALLKQAQTDLARYRILAKEDSIAQQTVDGQAQLVRQYEGTIQADQSQVDSAKLNIAYCHVVAPVGGKVGLRQVDQGNYITPGDANGIVVITQMKPITAIFSLPEDDLPTIVKRLNAGATLDVAAYDRTNTTKLATGTLVSIDNQIDTTTGTVKLRAQFNNEDGLLFPNQFVNIRLLADVLQNVTVIPTAAVQRGAPGTFVYMAKPDNTVAVQTVKLGPTDGTNVAITTGLAPGENVVIDGADKLRDKAKIVLRQETAPAAPGTTVPATQQSSRRSAPAP